MRKFLIKQWLRKHDWFWETRTRIFAWYVGLTTMFVGLSIPIFTELTIIQVDLRVKEDLLEEIEAFEESFRGDTEEDIAIIFDRFLQYKIPGDKTFLIATINGQFYRSSPISLPQAISRDSPLIKNLAQTKKPLSEKNTITDSQVGDILYQAEPVEIDGQVRGVLIVANIPPRRKNRSYRSNFSCHRGITSRFHLSFNFGVENDRKGFKSHLYFN